MFTIEHEFDATIVTLVDDGEQPLAEDIVISAFEDCVTVQQFDERSGHSSSVSFSLAQLRDLQASLNLPEGSYAFAGNDD